MIKLKIDGMEVVQRAIATYGKQARFAAAQTINKTAFDVMRDGRAHIKANVNASRWTETAWYVRKKAKKDDLVASVGWSDYLANKRGHAAEYYLSQHWTSGSRKHKAFESRLIRAGMMPAGMFAMPGDAAKGLGFIDARGNFKASALVQILSQLGAFTEAGYNANATTRQSRKVKGLKAAAKQVYWAGKPGRNTPNGIWALDEKHGNGRGRLRPVMVFVSKANYKKRLDLSTVAKINPGEFEATFWAEFRKAVASAR